MKNLNRHVVVIGIVLFLSASFQSIVAQTPRTIRRAESLPSSTPWDLAGLSEPPDFTWVSGDEIRSLYFAGEEYKGKPTRVFAYYATPDTSKSSGGESGAAKDPEAAQESYPAIVLVHGGGGMAFPNWVKLWASRGYAAIAMDLAGNGPGKKRLADGGPGQGHDMKFETIGLPVNEQWTYHAVANVICAHSLIQSFPEVDSSRTAVTGISWGGYLTCIVAGLDNRFKAAVPVYGCGFLQENSCWLGDFAKMTAGHREKWVKLWDPSRYVASASMPMLFVNGGKDFAYPPDSHAKTFSLVRSPKYLHFVPDLPHGHIFDRPQVIEQFIDHRLKGAPAVSRISSVERKDGEVVAIVSTERSLKEASVHYTTESLSGDSRQRVWETQPARIVGKQVIAAAPPISSTAWFVTVRDDSNVLVSSPVSIGE